MTNTDTITRGPGRPREDHVPVEAGHCDKHGPVELRLHKAGKRKDGSQKYTPRCPQCHNEKNQGYAS